MGEEHMIRLKYDKLIIKNKRQMKINRQTNLYINISYQKAKRTKRQSINQEGDRQKIVSA